MQYEIRKMIHTKAGGSIAQHLPGHFGVISGSFRGHFGVKSGSLRGRLGVISGSKWDRTAVLVICRTVPTPPERERGSGGT